jgi:ribA/ribD-fused uncharacterized protein
MTEETYICFWKPNETNGYLGNWYNSPFTIDNIQFINSEQYFMWRKLKEFDPDNDQLEKELLKSTNSAEMKAIGQQVKNYKDKVWATIRYDVMKTGLLQKFIQNPHLLTKLLNTKDAILVEASPRDKIWGIGLNAEHAMSVGKENWPGENLLGKCLMEVREMLKNTKN